MTNNSEHTPKSIKDIDNEYLAIIRDALGWIYPKLDAIDQLRFEQTLVHINNTLFTTLTQTLIKKQILRETKSMDDTFDLFKLSRN